MNNSAVQEIDDDLVYYCRSCHSLKIMIDEDLADELWDGSYCGDCQSTDIGTCTMEEWLAVEEEWRKKREEIEWTK